jgi:hypothetical protein
MFVFVHPPLFALSAPGRLQAKSTVSLYAGVGSGLVVLALEAFAEPTFPTPLLQTGLAAVLTFVMGRRYLFSETGAFMPAGLVATASLGMTAVFGYRAASSGGKAHGQ